MIRNLATVLSLVMLCLPTAANALPREPVAPEGCYLELRRLGTYVCCPHRTDGRPTCIRAPGSFDRAD